MKWKAFCHNCPSVKQLQENTFYSVRLGWMMCCMFMCCQSVSRHLHCTVVDSLQDRLSANQTGLIYTNRLPQLMIFILILQKMLVYTKFNLEWSKSKTDSFLDFQHYRESKINAWIYRNITVTIHGRLVTIGLTCFKLKRLFLIKSLGWIVIKGFPNRVCWL